MRKIILSCAAIMLTACASLNEGKVLKKFVISKSWARHTISEEYLGARVNHVMAPLLVGDMVISGNEIDSLTAYEQKSGQTIWRRSFNGGITANAVEDKGILYFGAGDGFFYALNVENGRTKWAFPLKAEGIGAPLVTDDLVYFIAGNNAAYALKKSTGEQVWYYSRVDTANLSVRGASEPSVAGNKILMGFSDGYLVALDRTKGTWIWERQLGLSARFRDVDAKAVVDGDKLYVSSYDGQLYCLKVADGQTIWTNDEGGFTPVTVYKEKLFYSTSTRKVMAIEKSSGRTIWSIDLKNQVAGQPVVTRGLVLYGEWGGQLQAVEESTGRPVTSFSTGRGVTSRVVLSDDSQRMYVMTADANLFALKLQLKSNEEKWPWE